MPRLLGRNRLPLAIALLVPCLLGPAGVGAQGTTAEAPEPASRLEQINQARGEKAEKLEPETPGEIEQLIDRAITAGFLAEPYKLGVKIGGLIPGGGFSMGPRYYRPDLWKEKMQLDFSAVGSINQYYALEATAAFPKIANQRLDAVFTLRRNDYPSINYFGSGPRTDKNDRSNFRREDNFFYSRVGWRPDRRHLLLGMENTFLLQNVGPGINSRHPTSEEAFSFAETPGLEIQPRYLITGPFANFDFRDKPGDPHSGGAFNVRYLNYSDRTEQRFSFRRLEAQAEQYFSFWNKKRVLALFSRAQLSYADAGQGIPFYMQPTLGGPGDLRAYTQFRFQDNNSLVFTGEYRWEVSSGFDMALFADAGNVFPRPGLIGFRNMQGGGGLGLRFKSRDNMALRLDMGVGSEGFRIWLSSASVFSQFR